MTGGFDRDLANSDDVRPQAYFAIVFGNWCQLAWIPTTFAMSAAFWAAPSADFSVLEGTNLDRPAISVATAGSLEATRLVTVAIVMLMGCVGWSVWRLVNARNLAAQISEQLAAGRPDRSWGFLPKLRRDRHGRLVARGGITALFCPVVCAIGLVWMFAMAR